MFLSLCSKSRKTKIVLSLNLLTMFIKLVKTRTQLFFVFCFFYCSFGCRAWRLETPFQHNCRHQKQYFKCLFLSNWVSRAKKRRKIILHNILKLSIFVTVFPAFNMFFIKSNSARTVIQFPEFKKENPWFSMVCK